GGQRVWFWLQRISRLPPLSLVGRPPEAVAVAKDPKWKEVFVGGGMNADPTAVRRALDRGMPIQTCSFAAKTQTPLPHAVTHWDRAGPDVIAVLLAAGANVNAPTRGSVYDGETAILVAARRGWLGLVRQLLKAGADPNHASSSGDTALGLVSHCDGRP